MNRFWILLLFAGSVTAGQLEASSLYINKFDGNIAVLDDNGNQTSFPTGHSGGFTGGMAIDSGGGLYIGGPNFIEKFDVSTGAHTLLATGFGNVEGLIFDAASSLYAANYLQNRIDKFDSNGVRSIFATIGVNRPVGLAFDSAGYLYAASTGDNSIIKIDPNGVVTTFASHTSNSNDSVFLAFDSADHLYAANQHDGIITTYNINGVGSLFASGLTQPQGLAFDSAGFLYVGEYGGSRITKFDTSSGVGTTFAIVDLPTYMAFGPTVPEPSSVVLANLGFVGLVAWGWRRRRR